MGAQGTVVETKEIHNQTAKIVLNFEVYMFSKCIFETLIGLDLHLFQIETCCYYVSLYFIKYKSYSKQKL